MPWRPPNHNCPCEAHREGISQAGPFRGVGGWCEGAADVWPPGRNPPRGIAAADARLASPRARGGCLPLRGVARQWQRRLHRPKQYQPHKGMAGAPCTEYLGPFDGNRLRYSSTRETSSTDSMTLSKCIYLEQI